MDAASNAGQSSRHDAGEAVVLGTMVLATFAETKVARSRQRAKPLVLTSPRDFVATPFHWKGVKVVEQQHHDEVHR